MTVGRLGRRWTIPLGLAVGCASLALAILVSGDDDRKPDFCALAVEIKPDGSHWGQDPNQACEPVQLRPPTTLP